MRTKGQWDRKALDKKIEKRKALFLKVMAQQFGNISASCEVTQMARATIYKWINDDPVFKEKLFAIDYDEIKGDVVESQLMRNILSGKEASIIFYCKTKLKKRGYIEKSEVDVSQRIRFLVSQPLTEEDKRWFDEYKKKI